MCACFTYVRVRKRNTLYESLSILASSGCPGTRGAFRHLQRRQVAAAKGKDGGLAGAVIGQVRSPDLAQLLGVSHNHCTRSVARCRRGSTDRPLLSCMGHVLKIAIRPQASSTREASFMFAFAPNNERHFGDLGGWSTPSPLASGAVLREEAVEGLGYRVSAPPSTVPCLRRCPAWDSGTRGHGHDH